MSSKGSGTQGNRYLMSLLSGLCRGPIDELVEIDVGDETAWAGHLCSDAPNYINSPDLFGGDDKEGGIQGPFCLFNGADDQVLPGAQGSLPDVRASVGGLMSQMRGVATVWFDGMVSAMNPYLKTWKFRVRRSRKGWFGGTAWYPAKATIYMGGDNLSVATNHPLVIPVVTDPATNVVTITFTRDTEENDEVTINGQKITVVKKDPVGFQVKASGDRAKGVRRIVQVINSHSSAFKVTAVQTSASTIEISSVKALTQIYAMNGAHIIYECFTNPLWGRGLPTSDVDENAMIVAANTLCDEGFGIALIWYRKEDIDEFIAKIVNLIGGVTYTDRETGKMVLKLIRNDYVVADLPLFTPDTGLVSIENDDAGSADEAYNEIIGTSRDPVNNLDFQVRAQNPAAYQAQGAPNTLDQDYKGIPTKELLQRVVLRDLRAMASGLKKYSITLDRRGWRVAPGSVIRISHPARGINNLVLRVGDIDDGNMIDGAIKIKAAVDVFGLPATSYQGSIDSGWVPPSRVAAPAADEYLTEAGYRDLYQNLGANDVNALDPTMGYIGQLARQPNTTSLEYDLAVKAEGAADYVVTTRGQFTGNAILESDIGPLDTVLPILNPGMFDASNIGQALLIGDEIVRFDAYDVDAKTITVTRGAADTVPAPHFEDDPIWTIDDDLVGDGVAYAESETIFAKVLTRTSTQVLDIDAAEEQSVVIAARHSRPYPPASVAVNGNDIYTNRGEAPEPFITWNERNRITQADTLVGYTEASVLPEAGTTYTIRVFNSDDLDTAVREVTGITEVSWEYTGAMQAADNATSIVRIQLVAVRDGRESYQPHDFAVVLKAGWGYGWGTNWGGN